MGWAQLGVRKQVSAIAAAGVRPLLRLWILDSFILLTLFAPTFCAILARIAVSSSDSSYSTSTMEDTLLPTNSVGLVWKLDNIEVLLSKSTCNTCIHTRITPTPQRHTHAFAEEDCMHMQEGCSHCT